MGKSTVGDLFKAQGIPVLSADDVVHQLYAKGGAAVSPVGELFPGAIVDEGAAVYTVVPEHFILCRLPIAVSLLPNAGVDRTVLSKLVIGNEVRESSWTSMPFAAVVGHGSVQALHSCTVWK
jgi:Dephospho-CoA kinase